MCQRELLLFPLLRRVLVSAVRTSEVCIYVIFKMVHILQGMYYNTIHIQVTLICDLILLVFFNFNVFNY